MLENATVCLINVLLILWLKKQLTICKHARQIHFSTLCGLSRRNRTHLLQSDSIQKAHNRSELSETHLGLYPLSILFSRFTWKEKWSRKQSGTRIAQPVGVQPSQQRRKLVRLLRKKLPVQFAPWRYGHSWPGDIHDEGGPQQGSQNSEEEVHSREFHEKVSVWAGHVWHLQRRPPEQAGSALDHEEIDWFCPLDHEGKCTYFSSFALNNFYTLETEPDRLNWKHEAGFCKFSGNRLGFFNLRGSCGFCQSAFRFSKL